MKQQWTHIGSIFDWSCSNSGKWLSADTLFNIRNQCRTDFSQKQRQYNIFCNNCPTCKPKLIQCWAKAEMLLGECMGYCFALPYFTPFYCQNGRRLITWPEQPAINGSALEQFRKNILSYDEVAAKSRYVR